MFSTLHLFAGSGGGLLADLILGHFPKYAVERDPYCCAVLRDRFPKTAVIESDVRDVDFSRMVGVDAICAGFPCQDISLAGKGAGIHGARSGMYREVVRAVESIKPGIVFLENSPEIRTRGRHIVIGDFVALGYSWRDGLFAASDCGAPHKRRRWFCVCANANSKRLEKREGSRPRKTLSPTIECGWWHAEPGMGRVVDGVADRAHRIRALGNGQVPIQAALAYRILTNQ